MMQGQGYTRVISVSMKPGEYSYKYVTGTCKRKERKYTEKIQGQNYFFNRKMISQMMPNLKDDLQLRTYPRCLLTYG